MKKVLIVFNHPAPYKVRLFNELSKYFELHVIFERNSASDRNSKFYFENKYNFITHKIKGLPLGKENIISSGVAKHLKENKYDLIVVNGYSTLAEMKALSYLKKHKISYLFYINGGVVPSKECKLKAKIKRHFIEGAMGYLSPDEESNKYLIHYGANEKKIFNYPYSTIYQSEILKSPSKKNNSSGFEKTFVSSGQLIRRKNYIELVKVWAKMPKSYALYIYGDGKQKGKIQKLIRKEHIENVILKGFLPRNEMLKFYSSCDAFIFPSKKDIYGHVVNEALSQGLPVISSNKVNSAIHLIKNGMNGYLLDHLDSDNLCSAIKKLDISNHFDSCIKTASENTIEKMAKKHVEIFEGAIK